MTSHLEGEPTRSDGGTPRRWPGIIGRHNAYTVLWALQVGSWVLFTPVDTRLLGPGRFGVVAAAIAVTQIIYVLASLQLHAGIRRRYEHRGEDDARRLLLLAVVLAVGAVLVAEITGPVWSSGLGFGRFQGAPQFAVVWGGLIAVTGGSLSLLQSQDRLGPFCAVTLLQAVGGQLLAVALVVGVHRTASTFVLGLLGGQAAAAIVALGYAPPRWASRHDVQVARTALAYSLPLVPGAVAAVVLGFVDRLVIQSKLGSSAVGRYQVAYGLGSLAIALLGGLNLVWLPRVLASEVRSTRAAVLAASRNTILTLLLPVVIGLSLGGPVLLEVAAPSGYHPDGLLVVLTLLAVSAIPYAGSLAYTRVLLDAGRTRYLAAALVAAAAVDIVANVVLIPPWHLAGSAAATLASYSMLGVLVRRGGPNRQLKLTRTPWATVGLLAIGTVWVGAWSEAPMTTPWIVLRALQAGACVVWFAAIADRLLGHPSPLGPNVTLAQRRSGRGDRPDDAEAAPSVLTSAEADRAADGRLRRGLPAGLLDSGFSSLSSFLMGLVATHYLLPDELGEYAVFYAAFLLAAVVPATLIFTPIEVTALALSPGRRLSVLHESVPLGGLTGFVSGTLVCGAVVPLVAKVGLTIRVEFAVTVVVLSCVSPVQDHLRRMFHQSGQSWIAARTSIIQLVTVATVIVVARIAAVPLPLIPFGALAVGNIVSAATGLRTARPRPGDDRLVGLSPAEVVRGGGWLTFGTAFGFAAGLAAVAILTDRSGAVAAGEAEAARVLSQPVTVIAVGVLAVFGPEMMSAARRGLATRVNKMMIGFIAVVAVAAAVWLLAVGVRWPWSPIGRTFSTAYKVGGLTPWMIAQQALGYASLAYRSVLIGNGHGRRVGKLDVLTGVAAVTGVYVAAPYIGPFALVWVYLGIDVLLFGVRAAMAGRSVRAVRAPADR